MPFFWRTFVATILVIMAIVAVLNLAVDPFAIYGTGLLPRADVNHYERKLELYRGFEPKPEALIIGNSRALAFDPEVVEELTRLRCFNFAVPGAQSEGIYSVYRLATEQYDAPVETVIVMVSPEAFHPLLPIQPESRYIDEYARYYIYHEGGRAGLFERLSLLATLDQTDESIGMLQRWLKGKAGQRKMEYREDGYSIWVQLEGQIDMGTFDLQARLDERVRKYPERNIMLSSYDRLDAVRKKYWEDFLDLADEDGVMVYAFMPPVHPELYDLLTDLGADEIFGKVRDYLGRTVEEHGGIFRDYTKIDRFGGVAEDFYDETHMRPQNGERLLRDLLRGVDDDVDPGRK